MLGCQRMASRTAAPAINHGAELVSGQRMALVQCKALPVHRQVAVLQLALPVGVHPAAGNLPPTDV